MHYVFFGITILALSLFYKKKHKTGEMLPTISFIVAAYNEEEIIRKKIINDLNLDYPKDKIEIIIISDGSNDDTYKISKEYQELGIIAMHTTERKGKTDALNRAARIAKNEILVFSDANSMFTKNALKKLVRNFYDPSIGGVSGRKSILKNSLRQASTGDHLFWKYESALKQAESHIGSIPTADGEIFALRKELFSEINPKIINDDMAITLNIIKNKKRVIYDQEAITEEEASITLKDDFNVKARMVYGGIQILSNYNRILNPLRSLFGLQFFFHKTLRYFMWALLLLIFSLNLILFNHGLFFKIFLTLQVLFYLFALIGHEINKNEWAKNPFYLPYYFCNVQVAAFNGFIYFLKDKSLINIWQKAKR